MEQYQTEAGRREDLESLETNPVIGFIGERIYPTVNTAEKQGRVYYKTLTADSAAQTSRSSGTAPTRTLLTDSTTTFTCTEVIKRYGVDRDEVKQMGGIAAADKLGASASKRSVQRFLEEQVADEILLNGSATVDDIENDFIGTVQTGLEAIRRYPGRSAFVASYTIFNRLMKYQEVIDLFSLSSAAIGGATALDIVARNPNAFRVMLQGILGVDEVLIGDDDQWYDSDAAKQDRAALVKLPDPAEFSHKMDPVLGKRMLYLPDGTQPYHIEAFYDPDDKINNYDAAVWTQLQTLNAGAIYILDGLDALNAISTTV